MKTAEDYLDKKPSHVDTLDRPRSSMGKDGKRVVLGDDEILDAAFAKWQSEACDHPRLGIVKTTYVGGRKAYNWYCSPCGMKLSSNINQALAMPLQEEGVTGEMMAERCAAYEQRRREEWSLMADEAADRCQAANRAAYNQYLDSDHWEMMRRKVMRRADNICEGCLSQTAEHVHHKTYAHIGAEFAFELLALCEECHDRFHEA